MGLLREICSEIVDLPDAFSVGFDDARDVTVLYYKIKYALVNIIFQIIDCIIIPLSFYQLLLGTKNIGTLILIVILGLSSLFSIFQFLYYLFKPTNLYTNFFYQLLGETAIGVLCASVFKISIKHYTQ
jgi:hypothetical protein